MIGLFERLRVETEHRGGYRRDAVFGGWLYSGGRSTRDRVLADECRIDGTWLSAYDGVSVSAAGDLDIDHLVPLAEAWESGGHAWSADTWARFGNDLGDPRSLIAVSAQRAVLPRLAVVTSASLALPVVRAVQHQPSVSSS